MMEIIKIATNQQKPNAEEKCTSSSVHTLLVSLVQQCTQFTLPRKEKKTKNLCERKIYQYETISSGGVRK
jgi:hypothetical protein